MSISRIQRKRKLNQFKQELLKNGITPNNYELNLKMSNYLDDKILGMPSYSPIKQKPYDASSKENYNHNFETFKEDIETIFEANVEANNKAIAMQENYDHEKNKVMNEISKLSLRIENVSKSALSNNSIKQYVEAFNDLYGLELYGDEERNIPYTTSFIDLLQKKVYTEKSCSKVNKISLSNATIKLDNTFFSNIYTDGELKNVLNDVTNSYFIFNGITSNSTKEDIGIIVDIGNIVDINCVLFSFTSSSEIPCMLSVSMDGVNYTNVYSIIGTGMMEWNFYSSSVRYIKIIMSKEPDGLSLDNNGKYEYHLTLKNISIAHESFEAKSLMVTKPITFNDLTSTIRLDATDLMFNNTRIDYFIGFDNGVDKIGWDSIKNHEDNELFMFEKKNKIVNAHIEQFGTQGVETKLYRLYEIPSTANRNSLKVTPCYNMWSVKKYNRRSGDSDDGFHLSSCDFTEFSDKCNMTQLFMDCENYQNFVIDSNVLYVFTQYVSLSESKNLYNVFLKVMDTNCISEIHGAEIKVYVNGYEVSKISDQYSFALKNGTNKIQMVIYVPCPNAVSYKLYHNVNFKALTNDVFGFPSMSYINYSVLDKQMGNNYSHYTIKDGYICVKCNPNDMVNSPEDMGYFITYMALKENMKNYFTNNKLSFRIMAILNSNDIDVSPQLVNFRITGK